MVNNMQELKYTGKNIIVLLLYVRTYRNMYNVNNNDFLSSHKTRSKF